MKSGRTFLFGLSTAFLGLILIVGALLAAIAENSTGGASSQASISPTPLPTTFTYLPTPSPTMTPTKTPTPTLTQIPCQPPEGWTAVVVQPGDSLLIIAEYYQITPESLIEANCLPSEDLTPGSILYVPAVIPISSGTPTSSDICGPPPGWVEYVVLPGDSLFQLSVAFDVSVEEIQLANCLGSSTSLQAGTIIFMPDIDPQ